MNAFLVKTSVGGMCNNCIDDDAIGSFESLLNKDELEVNFCSKIRSAQGSKYLSSAKSCAIQFDADADSNKEAAAADTASTKAWK